MVTKFIEEEDTESISQEENQDYHKKFQNLYLARNKKNWATLLNSINIQKKIRKYYGIIAVLDNPELFRQAGSFLVTILKIRNFQYRYRNNIRRTYKTTEEERLAKKMQRKLEEEAEALAFELVKSKFKHEYVPFEEVLIEHTLTDSLYFESEVTQNKVNRSISESELQTLINGMKEAGLIEIETVEREIREAKFNSLKEVCKSLPYELHTNLMALLFLVQDKQISLEQEHLQHDIIINWNPNLTEIAEEN